MTSKPVTKSDASGSDEAQVFDSPNPLEAEPAVGPTNVCLTLDEELLARAEARIEGMVGDYLNWVKDDVLELEQAQEELAQDTELGSRAHDAIVNGAFGIASQGGTFGFELLAAIGTALQDYASALVTIDQTHVTVIKLHIDAMRVVLRQNLAGNGGEPGAQLLKMLYTAAKKTV